MGTLEPRDEPPLSYDAALVRSAALATQTDAESVPLAVAVNRVTASPVVCAETSPTADLSAMDGFAVRWQDIQDAAPLAPVSLRIIGSIAAGDRFTLPLRAGRERAAVQVTTGAMVPEGFDTVLPIEQVTLHGTTGGTAGSGAPGSGRLEGGEIAVTTPLARGSHFRYAGEDHRPGDTLLEAGTVITPPRVLLLANLGRAEVNVHRRPRVAVVATGTEVISDLTAKLQPGQVRNSNARYLAAVLPTYGAEPIDGGTVHDDPESMRATLDGLAHRKPAPDVIITIGGVSKGGFDFVPAALNALHADIVFHEIAIRPGRPVLCARLPDPGATAVFGLPGNPIAVMATFRFLVLPYLFRLQQRTQAPPVAATLEQAARGRPPLTRFLLAHRSDPPTVGDQPLVTPLDGQAPSKVGLLAIANCWIIVPTDAADLRSGATVQTVPL